MKYLAAYALVALSGKTPSKSAVEAVLKAAGVPVDAARVTALFAELEGKNFEELSAEGKAKLVGSGSAAPASGAAAGSSAAPAAAAAKEEVKEEEEDDDEMGFGLFD
ncbi:large subunit ribosomal protein LP2 [Strigomonas culicis]|uniref:Large subunit ribosomal protein LP2 n=1 Tax=Strigomonas culicis TaxID=28005 RepID=S9UX97_9TRYP|nr:large subunit ribosomal protein LP2 [Strigomonas culicis]|eukprot:EPY15140.1 large subunit ribosomal protein LP2 [Strigomonas culicis]